MKDTNGKCGCCGGSNCKCCCVKTARLSVCNLAVAMGLLTGLCFLSLAWLDMLFGVGREFMRMYGQMFTGYHSTFLGGILGFLWGFLEGFVLGGLLAMFYNMCRCCCRCRSCKMERGDSCK